jgi:hypothetical protein
MPTSIKNGRNGNTAKVDKKDRLHTFSITQSDAEAATEEEKSYNINSGLITLTTAGESGVLYFKNDETVNFHINAVVVILGPSTGGSTSDTTHIRIYKNPTTGTLISGASAVDVNSNRDFGSSATLSSSLAYKGAEGNTITDGSVHIESLVSPGSRAVFSIDEVLRKGNSIAVSYERNDSNTSMKVMAAIIGHQELDTED